MAESDVKPIEPSANKIPMDPAKGHDNIETPPKLPKSVLEARAPASEQNVQMAAAEIAKNSPLYKRLWSAMNANVRDKRRPENAARTDKEHRMNYIAQYVLDAQTCTCKGFNNDKAFSRETKKCTKQWLTQASIGAPLHLNGAAAANVLCESGDLGPPRPYERPSLAEEGWAQYLYDTNNDKGEVGNDQTAGTASGG